MPTDSRTPAAGLPAAALAAAERDKAAAFYHEGNPAGSTPDRAETSLTGTAAARQNDHRDHR